MLMASSIQNSVSVKDVDISKSAAFEHPIIFIACEKDGLWARAKQRCFRCPIDKEMLLVEDAEYGMGYAVSRHSGNSYENMLSKWIERLGF